MLNIESDFLQENQSRRFYFSAVSVSISVLGGTPSRLAARLGQMQRPWCAHNGFAMAGVIDGTGMNIGLHANPQSLQGAGQASHSELLLMHSGWLQGVEDSNGATTSAPTLSAGICMIRAMALRPVNWAMCQSRSRISTKIASISKMARIQPPGTCRRAIKG